MLLFLLIFWTLKKGIMLWKNRALQKSMSICPLSFLGPVRGFQQILPSFLHWH